MPANETIIVIEKPTVKASYLDYFITTKSKICFHKQFKLQIYVIISKKKERFP
jgi:hypothetical protein